MLGGLVHLIFTLITLWYALSNDPSDAFMDGAFKAPSSSSSAANRTAICGGCMEHERDRFMDTLSKWLGLPYDGDSTKGGGVTFLFLLTLGACLVFGVIGWRWLRTRGLLRESESLATFLTNLNETESARTKFF
jgi:hypothetical protein